jgi:hypothetical protein
MEGGGGQAEWSRKVGERRLVVGVGIEKEEEKEERQRVWTGWLAVAGRGGPMPEGERLG